MTEYDKQLAHLAQLAMTPGWWQYARVRARELEQDTSGAYQGLTAAVALRVQQAGYRPAPGEVAQWWR